MPEAQIGIRCPPVWGPWFKHIRSRFHSQPLGFIGYSQLDPCPRLHTDICNHRGMRMGALSPVRLPSPGQRPPLLRPAHLRGSMAGQWRRGPPTGVGSGTDHIRPLPVWVWDRWSERSMKARTKEFIGMMECLILNFISILISGKWELKKRKFISRWFMFFHM